jgi:hypothetical protein
MSCILKFKKIIFLLNQEMPLKECLKFNNEMKTSVRKEYIGKKLPSTISIEKRKAIKRTMHKKLKKNFLLINSKQL